MTSFNTTRSKMSFFGGNPFSTPVGQRIDQATDASLASENWGLNMEICDIINETDEGPKDAIKAIKKKLSNNVGKNWNVVMFSLTVLETCVKNCGRRFHVHVANKDFLHELVKIIGPKNDPPTIVQEKILSLIQTWADAFRGSPDLKEVEKVYTELKSKGIEFPMTDLDCLAPIHTPARSIPETDPAVQFQGTGSTRADRYRVPDSSEPPVPAGHPQPAPQPHYPPQQQPPVMTGPVMLNTEQLAKLRSELDIVQGNVKVFGEMLTEMTPGQENREDLELLQELNRTCRQMQQRLVDLVERVANEEVTEELLRVNDDLNNVFLRYDRFERYRTGQGTDESPAEPAPASSFAPPAYPAATFSSEPKILNTEPPRPVQAQAPQPAPASAGNLIDLGDTPSPQVNASNPFAAPSSPNNLQDQLANMNLGSASVSSTLGQLNSTTANTGGDDFDMFAQSRQSFDQSRQGLQASNSSYAAQQQQDNFTGGLGAAVTAKTSPYNVNPQDKAGDYDEMEQWLKTEGGVEAKEETATSSEFDKFLAERAKAADSLPDANPPQSSNTPRQSGRQLPKEETENALFAL